MPTSIETGSVATPRTPWNKGKITGAKPPLQPKHVWAIRSRLQLAGRKRDLALFNLAVVSKLRGCDVFSLNCGADIEVLKRREGWARVRTIGEGTIQP